MPTFHTYTFGCRVNIAETEKIKRSLISNNFEESEKCPDFYIINSCAVTGKAEREVRQHIYQTRKKFPKTKILVTGCAATRWINDYKNISDADLLIPNKDKYNLANQLIFSSSDPPLTRESRSISDKFISSGRVFIKIQDGCSRFCSFCIVPILRGKPTTRTSQDIVDEINSYGGKISEAILTGINTEYFGIGNKESLTLLVDKIMKNTKVPRVSFGSIHPWSINDEFINWYKNNNDNPRLVNFFHIPIQSGADKILKLMNRGYNSKDILDKIYKIHKINPDALIGTDVIVGFPEETERDFRETYEYFKNSPINKFHIFRYSERSGTRAANLDKTITRVSPEVKKIHSEKLISLSKSKMKNFQKSFIGKTLPVLMLVEYKNGYQAALLPNQLKIRVKNSKLINPGSIVQTKVHLFKY